ncbi:MAG: deoxyribonuclease IV [Lachnospiraceae bacterium]|nr:deoxyribonuclease IV [Lachnospiraceae bacterium]
MQYIGTHLSLAKGFLAMGKDALSIQANTFQCFLRNPRGAKAKELNIADITALNQFMKEHSFAPIVAHAPYTMNPCSTADRVRELAYEMFEGDLACLEYLPGNYYNFHPGSHLGQGAHKACIMIADLLNRVLKPEQSTIVLLETMSGKGSEVGGSLEELRMIIDRVELSDKLGVCLDTCHVSDAGYDIINDPDGVLNEFDTIIGLNRLHAIHLNDSLNPPGSRKDRHACIGEGTIGLEALLRILNHPQLAHLPFLLETPNDLKGHGEEISLLKKESQRRKP